MDGHLTPEALAIRFGIQLVSYHLEMRIPSKIRIDNRHVEVLSIVLWKSVLEKTENLPLLSISKIKAAKQAV